jgi:hypothetical protein
VTGFQAKESNRTQLSRQKLCTHPLHVRLAQTSAVLDIFVEERVFAVNDHNSCCAQPVVTDGLRMRLFAADRNW